MNKKIILTILAILALCFVFPFLKWVVLAIIVAAIGTVVYFWNRFKKLLI